MATKRLGPVSNVRVAETRSTVSRPPRSWTATIGPRHRPVAIAVVAATAALWAALNIKAPAAVAVASLVMGVAVSSMHYTGMIAVSVDVTPSTTALPGATAMQFIFPLAVGLGSYLFLTSAFVALSPTAGEREASASAQLPVESSAH